MKRVLIGIAISFALAGCDGAGGECSIVTEELPLAAAGFDGDVIVGGFGLVARQADIIWPIPWDSLAVRAVVAIDPLSFERSITATLSEADLAATLSDTDMSADETQWNLVPDQVTTIEAFPALEYGPKAFAISHDGGSDPLYVYRLEVDRCQ